MTEKTVVVITSISNPSQPINQYHQIYGSRILWIGDRKSEEFQFSDSQKFQYVSLYDQDNCPVSSWSKFSRLLPKDHYARKNIGYLHAINQGAEFILDTDDDNFPKKPYQKFPDLSGKYEMVSNSDRYNVYRHFSKQHIWPRGYGYPLEETRLDNFTVETIDCDIAVWQGLADIDPDVDAIYRLAGLPPVEFEKNDPIILDHFCYCPINSQNTLWDSNFIALAYLPSTVTFRFTDILRGYIAQRLIWHHNKKVGFVSANVFQKRNDHNLLSDLKSEISMYEDIPKLIELLNSAELTDSLHDNLIKIYTDLSENKIVDSQEIEILHSWLEALDFAQNNTF